MFMFMLRSMFEVNAGADAVDLVVFMVVSVHTRFRLPGDSIRIESEANCARTSGCWGFDVLD
jgi:hypothetical protein